MQKMVQMALQCIRKTTHLAVFLYTAALVVLCGQKLPISFFLCFCDDYRTPVILMSVAVMFFVFYYSKYATWRVF